MSRARGPRAMILAAGLGTRLRPLTERTPKPLVEVAGQPLIAYGLGLLSHHGIEDVVVNVHHMADRVMEALGDGSCWGVRIHYSVETELLDTGGGIRNAAPLLDRIGRERGDERGPIVIANSDVISEVPVDAVVRLHRERGALVTLVLRPDPAAARYGLFGVDGDGRIRRFLGEGHRDRALREYMFASLQVIERSVIDRMPERRAFGTMRDFYPELFRAGEPFYGFVYDGLWRTADTAADLATADAALRAGGLPAFMLGGAKPLSAAPRR